KLGAKGRRAHPFPIEISLNGSPLIAQWPSYRRHSLIRSDARRAPAPVRFLARPSSTRAHRGVCSTVGGSIVPNFGSRTGCDLLSDFTSTLLRKCGVRVEFGLRSWECSSPVFPRLPTI